ncbi:MAG: ATP-binding protein, partial [candidate division WOR-3 bacterium]
PVGVDVYEDLRTKAKKVIWGKGRRNEFYCLFSKSGFTEAMIQIAKKERVTLVIKDVIQN